MSDSRSFSGSAVRVLEEKRVAGFDAAVLEADGAEALSAWLRERDYAITREMQTWVRPYIDAKWKVTAFKIAKGSDGKAAKVNASAVRLKFRTETPLFPYREPDYRGAAAALGLTKRTLRIFFIGDGRYQGNLANADKWSGAVAWSNRLSSQQRKVLLEKLQLPDHTRPA